jgi:hypothetical protein
MVQEQGGTGLSVGSVTDHSGFPWLRCGGNPLGLAQDAIQGFTVVWETLKLVLSARHLCVQCKRVKSEDTHVAGASRLRRICWA